jgi:hypothetical protein
LPQLLNIIVQPTFSTKSEVDSIPVERSFQIEDVYGSDTSEVLTLRSLDEPEFPKFVASFVERSKDMHTNGGVGFALVVIQEQSIQLKHVIPFGLPELLDGLLYDGDWLDTLKVLTAKGKPL